MKVGDADWNVSWYLFLIQAFESKENLIAKLNTSGRTYYVCKPCYHGNKTEHSCTECGAHFPTADLLSGKEYIKLLCYL